MINLNSVKHVCIIASVKNIQRGKNYIKKILPDRKTEQEDFFTTVNPGNVQVDEFDNN